MGWGGRRRRSGEPGPWKFEFRDAHVDDNDGILSQFDNGILMVYGCVARCCVAEQCY